LIPAQLQRTDPVLAVLDGVLDDDVLFAQVKADLCRRHPRSATCGRSSTPVEVVLRMLVVRRLYDWSYKDTVRFVWDSLSLRSFCRIGSNSVPSDTTLMRWANCLRPETMEALHARVVQLASERGVTRGRTLRIDGTVVGTTIHHPSDSSLLADAGRMLGRLLRRAEGIVAGDAPPSLFRDWTTSTKRLARQIGEAARKRGEEGKALRLRHYRRLLGIIGTVDRQARAVRQRLEAVGDEGAALRAHVDDLLPVVERVVQQTKRRLAGETVPAGEKIVSLVEPHTAIIKRDKPGQETEFGRKLILSETEGGIISEAVILQGNPSEAAQLMGRIDHHQQQFGQVPELVATDRGFYAPGGEAALRARGVRQVSIPAQGKPPPERQDVERSRWFRRGQRFRAGIEGRISVCKRRGWLGRCRDHGAEGFERWVLWGVMANNLVAIARYEAAQTEQQAA
jgi:transposase, IS5 family